MKWCLVAAGLKDLSRPADKLSLSQNLGTLAGLHFSHSILTRRFRISLDWDRVYLGPLFARHHTSELQFGCCTCSRC